MVTNARQRCLRLAAFMVAVSSCASPEFHPALGTAPIIGGQPVEADAMFATVAVDHEKFRCSGVLISPTVVFTAGHCVVRNMQPLNLNPQFELVLSENGDLGGATDLAILELSTPVIDVEPITIFPEAQLASLQGLDPVVLAGYGCRQRGGPIEDRYPGPSGVLYEGTTHRYVITEDSLHVAGTPMMPPPPSAWLFSKRTSLSTAAEPTLLCIPPP